MLFAKFDGWRKGTSQNQVPGTAWWKSTLRLHISSMFSRFFFANVVLKSCWTPSLNNYGAARCTLLCRNAGTATVSSTFLVYFLVQSEGDRKGHQRRVPAQRTDRDVSTWRKRKLAEVDKKRWGVGRRRGRSLCSVRWASSCCNFYLLAQSYLKYLACLALRVANFSAFHTDLSSGSPGAEGCSGNSQRSFSSETQKSAAAGQRQRTITREWLPAFSLLGANRRRIGASSSSSSSSRLCLYLGFEDGAAVHRVGRRPPLPLLSFTLNFCHQGNTQSYF